jgi:epoxyqueuosine reductase
MKEEAMQKTFCHPGEKDGGLPMTEESKILNQIQEEALERGASVAGSVPAARLKDCPSARAAGPQGFGTFSGTIVVLGLFHDPGDPELDWWEEGRGTPGDRILRGINRDLAAWLKDQFGITAHDIPYPLYDGGIYLKDAAVMAGLGVIGRNNLVITPRFGPRIRFRALWVDIEAGEPSLPPQVSPCDACDHPCESACPMDALQGGAYSRWRCLARMNSDRARKREHIDHCRACELTCPAGENSARRLTDQVF